MEQLYRTQKKKPLYHHSLLIHEECAVGHLSFKGCCNGKIPAARFHSHPLILRRRGDKLRPRLPDYFKERKEMLSHTRRSGGLETSAVLRFTCQTPPESGQWKCPRFYLVFLNHMRRWRVGRRRRGRETFLTSADLYQPLCMGTAPGRRCERHTPEGARL